MAVKWNLEADVTNKTMEEVLIEVFGCNSSDKKTAKINAGSLTKRIKTEFYLAGNSMETMLIEIFGCSSLDGNAVKFISDKEKKRNNKELFLDGYIDDQDTMPLSVSA